MKTEEEIEQAMDRAFDRRNNPKYSGMTYEQGVEDALRWVMEEDDNDPTTS